LPPKHTNPEHRIPGVLTSLTSCPSIAHGPSSIERLRSASSSLAQLRTAAPRCPHPSDSPAASLRDLTISTSCHRTITQGPSGADCRHSDRLVRLGLLSFPPADQITIPPSIYTSAASAPQSMHPPRSSALPTASSIERLRSNCSDRVESRLPLTLPQPPVPLLCHAHLASQPSDHRPWTLRRRTPPFRWPQSSSIGHNSPKVPLPHILPHHLITCPHRFHHAFQPSGHHPWTLRPRTPPFRRPQSCPITSSCPKP
jgi:hypothetical protein